MKGKQLTVLLATLAFLLPVAAIAKEIDVQTGNVRVSTYRDGSISVNSGQTQVELPPHNRSTWRWRPFRSFRTPWSVSCRNSNNSTYQKTTQTTQSGQRVVHHSVSTHSCR
ncbi:hypothetical protein IQ238_27070 [Pleurocapsales cyanobacterium LEGE 06147]|nr:hypothetical protein [Pleurocapsales cyanobacterium LEGE 06147]